jgi:Nucleoside-diphosphate-sugar epimerases
MKAIVTGADGFVGSYVVQELLDHDYQVIAIDLAAIPHRLNLRNKNLNYVCLPVDRIAEIKSLVPEVEGADICFHFAWRGSAGSERCDEAIQLNNALLTAKCLREVATIGVKRFVCAGTIMEFETNQVIYDQGSKPALQYIYGAGKTAAHEICKPIANDLKIDLIWAYITNTYGVGESSPRFLNSTIRKIINGESLDFTSGTQNYDFIYVTDVARAFRLLGEKGKGNKGYIIGSGCAKPLRKFVEDILDELKPTVPAKFGDIPYSGAMTPLETFSTNEIVADCGFKPSISFKDGVRLTFDYLKKMEAK